MRLFDYNKIFDKDYYNLIQNKSNTFSEVDFIIDVLQLKNEDNILDVGCGNGRHIKELSKRGYKNITGIELSEDLYKEAVKFTGGKAEIINADYIKYDFKGRKFDVVISFFSGFGYYDDKSNEEYVIKTSSLLSKKGFFLLDLYNFYLYIKKYENSKTQINTKSWNDFDPVTSISTTHMNSNNKKIKYKMRLYSISEILNILERNNLACKNIYGGYKGEKFNIESTRQIIISQKA